jgi:hypothetical protein
VVSGPHTTDQILAAGAAAPAAAGHHRLELRLSHRTEQHVLAAIDGLIAEGVLTKTEGRYPLVRRAVIRLSREDAGPRR